jgi:hypothetical protein
MTEKFTAAEVQSALENLQWEEPYVHYKYDRIDGLYQRVKNPDGTFVVESEGTYEIDFDWSVAEDEVGRVYDVLGGVEVVQSDPGGEGHGEEIYVVVKTLATGQFFRIDGYYASYGDGSVYEGTLREAFPEQRTITVYVGA